MTERDSDNDARGEGRARDFLGVVLALAVAAALGMLTLFLLFGWLHCPLGESGAIACDHREDIGLVAIPVGVIAGVLLWQRFEVTTRVEASRIGPWLPSLVVGVLIGASLVLIWAWGEGYRWYGPTRVWSAVALGGAAFVTGRF